MRLETERLVLREPRLEDADDVLELVGDDEVMRWIGGETGGHELAAATVERWLARWEQMGVGPFAVVLDGHVIGRAGFLVWDSRDWTIPTVGDAGAHAETELGWAIARRCWGHGYATEAARAARAWVYAERDVDRVISLIAPDNERSIRVAEKLGAAREERVETPHGPADVWVHPR
jgi:RimJ/RimL family protein N-acetyltransferase